MADREDLARLLQGSGAWNAAREASPAHTPQLDHTLIRGVELANRDLSGVNLRGSRLDGVDLRGADLSHASLIDTDLSGALIDASTRFTRVSANDLTVWPAGHEADDFDVGWTKPTGEAARIDFLLTASSLTAIPLADARAVTLLGGSRDMFHTWRATWPDLRVMAHETRLVNVDLSGWDLHATDFTDATLTNVDLRGADLRWADLSGADLSTALVDDTTRLQGATHDRHTRWPANFDPNDTIPRRDFRAEPDPPPLDPAIERALTNIGPWQPSAPAFTRRADSIRPVDLPAIVPGVEELLTAADRALANPNLTDPEVRYLELWRRTLHDHLYADDPSPLLIELAAAALATKLAPQPADIADLTDRFVQLGFDESAAEAITADLQTIAELTPTIGVEDPVDDAGVASQLTAAVSDLTDRFDHLPPAVSVSVPKPVGRPMSLPAKITWALTAVKLTREAATAAVADVRNLPALIAFVEAAFHWFVRVVGL